MHVKLTMFNWNDLESFIILSRSGKLNLAAKKLKIEPTTISRRILRLEEKLDVKLFYRSNNQYILTDDGTRLIIFAEKIESEILSINEEFTNKDVNLTGVVRISLPEGLGIEIFTKYLKEFYKEHRDLEIELLADTKARSLSNKEVDISITLSRPKKGKLVSWKLSDYVIQLYGSKEYFTKNKMIDNLEDLTGHKFISYVDDLVDYPELNYLHDSFNNIKILFRSNNLQAQLNAVKEGIGIALLHNFIAKKEKNLIPILPKKIKIKREYWIVIHEDLINIKRIRVVVDFISRVMKLEKNNLNI